MRLVLALAALVVVARPASADAVRLGPSSFCEGDGFKYPAIEKYVTVTAEGGGGYAVFKATTTVEFLTGDKFSTGTPTKTEFLCHENHISNLQGNKPSADACCH